MPQIPFQSYFLGCPQWKHLAWREHVFTTQTRVQDLLLAYAQLFNTVEGNTTFYATPQKEILKKWSEDVESNFRFIFKLHQEITHDCLLQGAALDLTLHWIEHFEVIHKNMGPVMIQLPARFTPSYINTLYTYLQKLPSTLNYSVELRHPEWTQEPYLSEVNQLLAACKVERIWMDTLALRQAQAPLDDKTQQAWDRKPNLPVYPIALGPHPMIRYVANPDLSANQSRLHLLAEQVAQWIREGRKPYFFAHYPGEYYAPDIAEMFHTILSQYIEIAPRPKWPSQQQLTLF